MGTGQWKSGEPHTEVTKGLPAPQSLLPETRVDPREREL